MLCLPYRGLDGFDGPRLVRPFELDPVTNEPTKAWFEYLNPEPGSLSGESVVLLGLILCTEDSSEIWLFTSDSLFMTGSPKADTRLDVGDLPGMPVSRFLHLVNGVEYIAEIGASR